MMRISVTAYSLRSRAMISFHIHAYARVQMGEEAVNLFMGKFSYQCDEQMYRKSLFKRVSTTSALDAFKQCAYVDSYIGQESYL